MEKHIVDTTPSTIDPQIAQRLGDPASIRHHMLHGHESMPTRSVRHGPGEPRTLAEQPHDLDTLPLSLLDDRKTTLPEFLTAADSTAILVMHRGTVVYERYLHEMHARDRYVTASMSKSLLGLIARGLIREGALDRQRRSRHYVPELADAAFGEATVHDLLHMATPFTYGGRPFNKEHEAQRFFAAVGIVPRPADYNGPDGILDHLTTAHADGPSGTGFQYENGNSEALAEVVRRITGTSLAELLSERLWSRIGAEADAAFQLDTTGREIACGRFSATLRDMARVGELLRCGGALGNNQILPETVVAGITAVPNGPAADVLGTGDTRGPDNAAVMGYHDYWWIPYPNTGAFLARGRSGQRLYIDPTHELVIAHYGAHPVSPNTPVPPHEPVFRQIAEHLDTPT